MLTHVLRAQHQLFLTLLATGGPLEEGARSQLRQDRSSLRPNLIYFHSNYYLLPDQLPSDDEQ